MNKRSTNWTMDGLPIEGGFDVAAAEDEEDTNNCDQCGKELDGPWDDFCEDCEKKDGEYEDDLDKEGTVRRATKSASATSYDVVDVDRAEYEDGWDQGFEDAYAGIVPDMSELLSGIHSLDWEAGYLDGRDAFVGRDEPVGGGGQDPNWLPGFDGGTIGATTPDPDPRLRLSSDDLREAMVEVYDKWELANAKGSPECDTLARTYLVLDDELTRRGMVLAEDDTADDQEEGLPWLEDVELEPGA